MLIGWLIILGLILLVVGLAILRFWPFIKTTWVTYREYKSLKQGMEDFIADLKKPSEPDIKDDSIDVGAVVEPDEGPKKP